MPSVFFAAFWYLLVFCRLHAAPFHLIFCENLATNAIGGTGKRDFSYGIQPAQTYSWPSRAYEETGHALVKKGKNFVDESRHLLIETYLDEFLEVYANRPDKVNLCGIRINHAYALWLAVKMINPQTVVESGVNAGQSTYFIRNASASTRIYEIDPEEKRICDQGVRWIDQVGVRSGLTRYFVGADFLDFQKVNWSSLIAEGSISPHRTLVFLEITLRCFLGFPGPAYTFCDNAGVVKNVSIPESVLHKRRHNAINYHVIRESVAADIMQVGKDDTQTNLSVQPARQPVEVVFADSVILGKSSSRRTTCSKTGRYSDGTAKSHLATIPL